MSLSYEIKCTDFPTFWTNSVPKYLEVCKTRVRYFIPAITAFRNGKHRILLSV